MDDFVIPEDVEQFVIQKIDSIAQWEGLLLLRADSKKEWDAKAISRRLYIGETDAAAVLAGLSARGFAVLSRPDFYRYCPQSAELASLIDRTAELYAKYLVPITRLIHSKPEARIREFAAAFKLRKD